jgi:exopolysaccharide production protein ExoQ
MALRQISHGAYAAPTISWRQRAFFFVATFLTFLKTMPFILQIGGVDPTSFGGDVSAPFYFYYRVAFLALSSFVIYLYFSSPFQKLFFKCLGPLILLCYIGLSSAWSFNWYTTMRITFEIMSIYSLAFLLNLNFDMMNIARILINVMGISLVLSVVWVVLFPAYGVHAETDIIQQGHFGDWRGIYFHKNALGQVAGLAVPVFLLTGRKLLNNSLVWLLYLVCAAACLFKSSSGTGVVIASVGLIVVGIFAIKSKSARFAVFMVGLLILPFIIAFGSALFSMILEALGKDSTLSGRTYLWSAAWTMIAASPIFGYGYYSTSNNDIVNTFLNAYSAENAHNAFLQMMLDGGLIGVILWLNCLVRPAKALMRGILADHPSPEVAFFSITLIGICASGLSEIQASNMTDSLSGIFWLIAVVTLSTQNEKTSPFSRRMLAASQGLRRQGVAWVGAGLAKPLAAARTLGRV